MSIYLYLIYIYNIHDVNTKTGACHNWVKCLGREDSTGDRTHGFAVEVQASERIGSVGHAGTHPRHSNTLL